MVSSSRKLAVVTGASSGIGYQLAELCAQNGFDLVIAADRSEIREAVQHFRRHGVSVDAVEADLARDEGVERVYAATRGRPVDALLANAGHGLGHAFLDQDFEAARHVIDTNITGTVNLIQKIGRDMRTRGRGRILITGSIAGFIPGSFQAVYNGTKAFIDSFSFALRNELKDTGVTVTCLMPGPTDTEFFKRADMLDTKVGQGQKDDPASVARTGFDAMMRGDGDIVAGWKNKLQTSIAAVTPSGMLAEQHRNIAEPQGTTGREHRTGRPSGRHIWSVVVPAGLAVAAGLAMMRQRPPSRLTGMGNGRDVHWRERYDSGTRVARSMVADAGDLSPPPNSAAVRQGDLSGRVGSAPT
ncbi:MAG: oxidoreductase [Hyphomicrobiales bacterium]|nr:oxidoreductase [Hyphomicrobiales bacterium]